MKKALTKCEDLRDFLKSNYTISEIYLISDGYEYFVEKQCQYAIYYVWERFKCEVNEEWNILSNLGFELYEDSFYSEWAQKLLAVVQDLSEKIVFEHDNPPCQAGFADRVCACKECLILPGDN